MLIETVSELVRQLRDYRQKAGLSQGDIAWKLGFALPTVSRWERGMCTPDLRAVGASIRHHLTGLYHDFIEDAAMVASLRARELSSVEIYSGAALATTSIPEGFVQLKRMTFQSQ